VIEVRLDMDLLSYANDGLYMAQRLGAVSIEEGREMMFAEAPTA
jgi:hypothetical protein